MRLSGWQSVFGSASTDCDSANDLGNWEISERVILWAFKGMIYGGSMWVDDSSIEFECINNESDQVYMSLHS